MIYAFVFKHYINRFWSIGELKKYDESKNLIQEWSINKFYKVDKDWFYILDCEGGSGTGYNSGEIIEKIFIGDSNYKKEDIYDTVKSI